MIRKHIPVGSLLAKQQKQINKSRISLSYSSSLLSLPAERYVNDWVHHEKVTTVQRRTMLEVDRVSSIHLVDHVWSTRCPWEMCCADNA
jgi:hypothetical protein